MNEEVGREEYIIGDTGAEGLGGREGENILHKPDMT